MGSGSNFDSEDKGCFIILGLVILIPMVEQLIHSIFPVAIIAGIGYFLYQFELKKGGITDFLNSLSKNVWKDKQKTLPDASTEKSIPPPSTEPSVLDEIKKIKEKVKSLELENQGLRDNRKQAIDEALKTYGETINKENQKDLLDNFFNEKPKGYARSDEFEKQEYEEDKKKKTEELELREMKQDFNEHLFEQDKKIHEYREEAKTDRDMIRSEMRTGFLEVSYKLLHLEKEFSTFKGLVAEKFAQIEINFQKALSAIEVQLNRFYSELKQDVSDTRLQFGKEIVRIDKQQIQIVGKMEEYKNQVKAFSIDVMKVKLDAEKFAIRGEDLLNRANTVHQRHKAEMIVKSKDLEMGLKQMALHNSDFSNKVGQSKLMLDEISQDQYFALKDMAYERIGINMLRQEHQQKSNLEEQKMQSLINNQRHIEEKIKLERSHGRAVDGLQHQLYMTNENLQFTRNRSNLMRQEFTVMKKLSR